MREKIKKLLDKIKNNKLNEWEESLVHDHIQIELEDFYFSNREYRRVK
jgi:hypothetical protein|tara:strand:- start:1 stop:144 length:144 start_codon:yes stop_codon:yes gene_type:complete